MTLSASTPSIAKEIALTFDDAPNASTHLDADTRTDRLIQGLREADVAEVAFFVIGNRLDREGSARVCRYVDAGHVLANHTHSHLDLDSCDLYEYLTDIRTADRRLRMLPGVRPWFRYPYLREGSDVRTRNDVRAFLDDLNYVNGYMTVKNHDWHMDVLVQRAHLERRLVNREVLRNLYVDVLVESAERTDKLARETLGRSPRHVLLLHENDLAAEFIPDLVAGLRAKGWRIISPTDAYADDIARFRTTDLFSNNPGRVAEMAYAAGWRGRLTHGDCDRLFAERGVFTAPAHIKE